MKFFLIKIFGRVIGSSQFNILKPKQTRANCGKFHNTRMKEFEVVKN
jgi:hypothetical protein